MKRYKIRQKSKKVSKKKIMLLKVMQICAISIGIIAFMFLILFFGYTVGYDECKEYYESGNNEVYHAGYKKGIKIGYETVYQELYNSAYYEGYRKGLSKATTEGNTIKTELINAYDSLIKCENLSEKDRKVFTYKLSQMLRSPVPEKEKAEEFIKDVQEILSTNT